MNKIFQFFTKDKLIVNLIIIVTIMYGVQSLRLLKQEHMPSVDIDKMTIAINYPGASAIDVELNAVIPIEDELREINGIDEYNSVSLDGMGSIMISIDQDVKNKQAVKDEIFRRISKSNLPDLPSEVDDLTITDINPRLISVYTVLLSIKEGSKKTLKELYDMSEKLEDMLKQVPGVSNIEKTAFRDREVHINVKPELLEKYNVSLTNIVNSIANRNVRSTGGTLQSTQREKSIVTIGQLQNPLDVGEVIIRSGFEQRRILVKDLADIKEDFDKEEIRVLVNGKPGVILAIKKKEHADVIQTVDRIKKFFQENKGVYDDDFAITLVEDDSLTIRSLLGVVKSNAIIGFFLVIIILFFFLDFRTSLWTAFGIPFSMMISVGLMYIFDISLNVMSIGAIITVLGMLVDDAIVVAENIYDKKQSGMSGMQAALTGTQEIIMPVTVTILSTIVAFTPMMMIKGIMGKFIFVFPVVVMITLLASLFESAFILPSHLSFDQSKSKKMGQWFIRYMNLYYRSLLKVLKWRYAIAVLMIFLFFGTFFIAKDSIANFVLFWDNSSEVITINFTAPNGTSLQYTEKLTQSVDTNIRKVISKKDLISTFVTVGKHGGRGFNTEEHDNWSSMQIKLVPVAERKKSAEEYATLLRKEINVKNLKEFTQIVIQVDKAGPPTGGALDIKIISKNDKDSLAVSKRIKKYLSSLPGVKNIDDDHKQGNEEILLDFDYNRLAQFDLDVQTVATTVRTAFEGNIASYVQTSEHRIEYRVQIDESYKINERFLKNLLIPNSSDQLIRLKDIASFRTREGRSSVKHYNGARALSISAEVDPKLITPAQVSRSVTEKFKNISKEYPGLYLYFAGETKETAETMSEVSMAFIMALTLIYFIVILRFRSFFQPFIILSVIPFGLIGVLLAFSAHSIPLSFMGIIGIIGLSGVVINDSILMVDYINGVVRNETWASREELYEKISRGARQRLRPILLTTLTTVAGLMPTVYGIGGEAKMMVPTVMAMAYGLLFATILTLYFVPSLYMIQMDFLEMKNKITARIIKKNI